MSAPDRIDPSTIKWNGPGGQQQQKGAADIRQSDSSARKSDVEANRTTVLTPEELRKLRLDNEKTERDLRKPPLTPGQEQQDKTFGAALPDWPGKRANTYRQIAELQKAIYMLQTEQNISGPGVKMTPAIGGIRSMVNPAAKIVQDAVENSIDLKAQLDAQFAAKEAAQVYARRYDPALPQKANLERAQVLLDSLVRRVANIESQAKYWGETDPVTGANRGTLQGYKPADVDKLANGILRVSMAEAQGIVLPPEEREAVLQGNPPPDILPSFRPQDASAPQSGPDGLSSMPRMPDVWRQGSAPEFATSDDKTFSSDTNLRITAKLQEAFDRGASADDMQALAKALYGETGVTASLDPAKLQANIRYRDEFLRNGGTGPSGATIMPREEPLTGEAKANVEALESAPNAFVFNLGHGLSGGAAPDIAGLFSPEEEARLRMAKERYGAASPKASFAGDTLGSFLLSKGAASGVTGLGVAPVRAAFGTDLALDTARGAFDNPENRIGGALFSGGVGLAGGTAGRWTGVEHGVRRIRPDAPLPPSRADSIIVNDIGKLDLAEQRLREAMDLGLPYGLADTSTHAQQLAVRSARESSDAAALAQGTYPERTLGRADRATDALNEYVAPVVRDIPAHERSIKDAAYDAASPLYRKAYSRPAIIDDELTAILDTKLGREALAKARETMEAKGVDPYQVGFRLDEKGDMVPAGETYSWEMLDWTRRGLNDVLDDTRNPVTRVLDLSDPKARNTNNLLRRFDDRADALNPDYKAARAEYARNAKPLDYFRSGLKTPERGVREADVDNTLDEISRMPTGTPEEVALRDAALQNYRQGFATGLDGTVANVKGADPYKAVFGSRLQQYKLRQIAADPDTFAKQTGMEEEMFATDAATQSAPRIQAAMDANQALSGPDLLAAVGETMAGSPSSSLNALMTSLAYRPAVWNRARRFGKLITGHEGRVERRSRELAEQLIGNDPSVALANLQRARSGVADYDRFAAPIRANSVLVGGNLAGAGTRAAQDEPAPYFAPRPLDQNLLVAGVYGPGSKINADGSVTTRDGNTIDAATVQQQVGETAQALSKYYDAPKPAAQALDDLASRYPQAPMNAAPDQIVTPDYGGTTPPAAQVPGLPPGWSKDPVTGDLIAPDGTHHPAMVSPVTGR